MLDASQSLLFVSSTSALFSQLSNRSVSSVCLLTDCSVYRRHINLVLLDASATSTLQTEHDGAASNAQAAQKDHHEQQCQLLQTLGLLFRESLSQPDFKRLPRLRLQLVAGENPQRFCIH